MYFCKQQWSLRNVDKTWHKALLTQEPSCSSLHGSCSGLSQAPGPSFNTFISKSFCHFDISHQSLIVFVSPFLPSKFTLFYIINSWRQLPPILYGNISISTSSSCCTSPHAWSLLPSPCVSSSLTLYLSYPHLLSLPPLILYLCSPKIFVTPPDLEALSPSFCTSPNLVPVVSSPSSWDPHAP